VKKVSTSHKWYVSWWIEQLPHTKLTSGPWMDHKQADEEAQKIAACAGAHNIKVYFEDVDGLLDGVLRGD